MNLSDLDIDWDYLLERLEGLMDMAEEHLALRLTEYQLAPQTFEECLAFRWQREGASGYVTEVAFPDLPSHAELVGLDRVLDRLRQNTQQFVDGLPANHVLLWGESGSGKSAAVKGLLAEQAPRRLRLVEVKTDDLDQLPLLTAQLRELPYRFIVFCDDLCLADPETGHRQLKDLLDGGIETRPENVLVYATSNRRQMAPEHLAEGIAAETLSVADHFGITLTLPPVDLENYLAIVRHLCSRRQLQVPRETLESEARQWALRRGTRSGRVARQFIDDLAGRLALHRKTEPPAS